MPEHDAECGGDGIGDREHHDRSEAGERNAAVLQGRAVEEDGAARESRRPGVSFVRPGRTDPGAVVSGLPVEQNHLVLVGGGWKAGVELRVDHRQSTCHEATRVVSFDNTLGRSVLGTCAASTLLLRRARRFLNRVRKFDSCRGHPAVQPKSPAWPRSGRQGASMSAVRTGPHHAGFATLPPPSRSRTTAGRRQPS